MEQNERGEMMAIEIGHVEKLAYNHAALTEAHRQGFHLQERGLMHFPPACWDQPALIASVGGRPVALVNYSISDTTFIASIDFAFCLPEYPKALTKALLVFRCLMRRDSRVSEVRFTYHAGNEAMHKAGHLLRAEIHSTTFKASIR